MKEEILIAGYGGQGVVVAGSLLANVAMEKGLQTCGMVSYGAEMRGGAASATVTISDEPIGSPVVVKPDSAMIMNEISLKTFESDVKENGLIILNISECKNKVARKDVKVIEIEATKIAEELGNKKAANMVMIGLYLRNKNIIEFSSALNMVRKVLPKANERIIELNKKALLKGYGK
jgi:2-oxoglutarate ferredoxin oxidoreductase subunit gamma